MLVSYRPPIDSLSPGSDPKPVKDSADVDEGIISNTIVLPFNNWEATRDLIERDSSDIASVIMEPFEDGVIEGDAEFMTNLRELTAEKKIPLIFDEVKTGFRVRRGGAAEFYSIKPDIECLGKIIGGGIPVGAVIGDRDIMRQLDPSGKGPGKVFHSGTFNGNPLAMMVGMATIVELLKDGNFESICAKTENHRRGFSAALTSHQVPHFVAGQGAMFNLYLTKDRVSNYRDAQSSDLASRRILDLLMLCNGIYNKPENRFCLSLAHSDDDIRRTVELFSESLDEMTN